MSAQGDEAGGCLMDGYDERLRHDCEPFRDVLHDDKRDASVVNLFATANGNWVSTNNKTGEAVSIAASSSAALETELISAARCLSRLETSDALIRYLKSCEVDNVLPFTVRSAASESVEHDAVDVIRDIATMKNFVALQREASELRAAQKKNQKKDETDDSDESSDEADDDDDDNDDGSDSEEDNDAGGARSNGDGEGRPETEGPGVTSTKELEDILKDLDLDIDLDDL
jgi:hypothetical protein